MLNFKAGYGKKVMQASYYYRFVLLLVFVSWTAVSCGDRRQLSQDMKRFVESEIVLPDDMECVHDMSIRMYDPSVLRPVKFIVYYDSLECSSCAVAHLVDLLPLYDRFKDSEVEVMTIFSPRTEEVEDVKVELMMADPEFPVYVDTNGTFAGTNTCIPADNRFDYFMIDGSGKPVFVGNPTANEKLMKLLDSILLTLKI